MPKFANEQDNKRKMCYSGISPAFPEADMFTVLMDRAQISKVVFCSVPDPVTKALPAQPQLFNGRITEVSAANWKGPVQFIFHQNRSNGYQSSQWNEMLRCMGMSPVIVSQEDAARVGNVKSLSKFFQILYSDVRSVELNHNFIHLDFAQRAGAAPAPAQHLPSAAASAAAAALAAACNRPPVALPPPPALEPPSATDLAQYATAKAPSAALLPEPARAKRPQPALSFGDLDTYISAKALYERDSFFSDQPAGPKAAPGKAKRQSAYVRGPYKKNQDKAQEGAKRPRKSGEAQQAKPRSALKTVTFDPQLPPAPEEPADWKAALAEFLTSPAHYEKRSRKGPSSVQQIRSLLPAECLGHPFFTVRSKEGLGLLYPGQERESDPNWPSTVELHRCTLNLEGAAERLLRAAAAAVAEQGQDAAEKALGRELALNLQDAWAIGGGVRGAGPAYWPTAADPSRVVFESLPVGSSRILAVLLKFRDTRHEAFAREVLLPCELSWGLPVLCKLFYLREELPAGGRLTQEGVRRSLSAAVSSWHDAVKMDRGPLVSYLANLFHYAECLAEVARKLGAPEQDLSLARRALEKAQTAGKKQPAITHLKSEFRRELLGMCSHLGVPAAAGPRESALLLDKLATLMSSDSYQAHFTRHLAPSPSLPDAKYDPGYYLRDAAGPASPRKPASSPRKPASSPRKLPSSPRKPAGKQQA